MSNLDLILHNGTIYTMDSINSQCSWVKISNGLITEMGNETDLPLSVDRSDAFIIDLKGKSVFPGFYDNHINLVQAGINSFSTNVSDVPNLKDLFAIIREKSKTIFPGELMRFVGFIEPNVEENRFPTRQELDICAPNNPVIVTGRSQHSSSVNSMMLHKLSLPYNMDGMEKDMSNTYSGYLTYKANVYARNQLFAQMDDILRTEGVNRVIELAIKNGFTSLVTFEGGYISHENHAKYIFNNKAKFPIDIKVFYQTTNLNKARNFDTNMLGGMFLDGTFSSKNAAISQNYINTESSGTLFFTQADINEFVLQAHKAGFQLSAHCVGDRAVEQMIKAYDYAQSNYFRENHRHRIEHCEIINEYILNKARDMEIIFSMQPSYEFIWGGYGKFYYQCMGNLGLETNNLRSILDAGIRIAGGTDHDITDLDPWLAIHAAVNHPIPKSQIKLHEAIKMFTIDGAYAVFEEHKKGSIVVGKNGDMIIVDKDPYNVPKEKLKDIKVLATIKEGNVIYRHEAL